MKTNLKFLIVALTRKRHYERRALDIILESVFLLVLVTKVFGIWWAVVPVLSVMVVNLLGDRMDKQN